MWSALAVPAWIVERSSWSIFEEDQCVTGITLGARRPRRALPPRSTGSQVVYNMPPGLVHAEHETSTI